MCAQASIAGSVIVQLESNGRESRLRGMLPPIVMDEMASAPLDIQRAKECKSELYAFVL